MKKSFLAVGLLLVIIASLPMIGNRYLNNYVQRDENRLTKHGIEIVKKEQHASYLYTQRHYEFVIRDVKKCIAFAKDDANVTINPYLKHLLEGSRFGLDVSYSNLVFAKSFTLELYPLALSQPLATALKKKDQKFYNEIAQFFKNKEFLYHLEYNLINQKYKGSLQDFSHTYTLADKTEFITQLQRVRFSGKGSILSPYAQDVDIEKFYLASKQKQRESVLDIDHLSLSTVFEALENYESDLRVKKLALNVDVAGVKKVMFRVKDLQSTTKSQLRHNRVTLASEESFGLLELKVDATDLILEQFSFLASAKDLDPQAYTKTFESAVRYERTKSLEEKKKLNENILELLSHGVDVKLKNFSLKNVQYNDQRYHGFYGDGKLYVEEDDEFYKKLALSPLEILKNIEFHSHIVFDEPFYKFLTAKVQDTKALDSYAKKEQGKVTFTIGVDEEHLFVNDKMVK